MGCFDHAPYAFSAGDLPPYRIATPALSAAQKMVAADRAHDIELAASLGWYPFGAHAEGTEGLEFSETLDGSGDPLWERVRPPAGDEYHTMAEIYDYRMLYNALAANALPRGVAVKSWKHSDGELCFGGGWFTVVISLWTGQISNHYKAEHWELFTIPEVITAPTYDGHTPQVAAERLRDYLRNHYRHHHRQEG